VLEATSTSETSVNFYQTIRRNIPEGSHLHILRRENLKFRRLLGETKSMKPNFKMSGLEDTNNLSTKLKSKPVTITYQPSLNRPFTCATFPRMHPLYFIELEKKCMAPCADTPLSVKAPQFPISRRHGLHSEWKSSCTLLLLHSLAGAECNTGITPFPVLEVFLGTFRTNQNLPGCDEYLLYLANQLAPWREVLLENLMFSKLFTKFPVFYASYMFIIVFTKAPPDTAAEMLALLLRIRKVLGTSLGQVTGYHDRRFFVVFLSSPQGNSVPRPHPSIIFLICLSLIIFSL
jgi:hypothetical protein